jgi:hypothetical protein
MNTSRKPIKDDLPCQAMSIGVSGQTVTVRRWCAHRLFELGAAALELLRRAVAALGDEKALAA